MGRGWIASEGTLDLFGLGLSAWPTAEIERAGPANIRTLNLSGNKLKSIPGDELAKLTNLTELYASGNQLTALPPEIGRLARLQVLAVDSNPLTDMPKHARTSGASALAYLRSLAAPASSGRAEPSAGPSGATASAVSTHRTLLLAPSTSAMGSRWIAIEGRLELSGMGLAAWPTEEIEHCGLANIRQLNLSHNKLTSIPGNELERLVNLEKLYVSSNRLGALPVEIGRLADLHVLDVRDNRLDALPTELGRLSGLRVLALNGNPLSAVPREARKSANAAVLYLHSLGRTSVVPVAAPVAANTQPSAAASRTGPTAGPSGAPAPEAPAPDPQQPARQPQEWAAALLAENAQLRQRLAEATAQQARAAALEAENAQLRRETAALEAESAELQRGVEELAGRLRLQAQQQAELDGRLALYEGGAALAAARGGRSWGEAELADAAELLQAAARRVAELRGATPAAAARERERLSALAALAAEEERAKRRRLNVPSALVPRFPVPVAAAFVPPGTVPVATFVNPLFIGRGFRLW
eukprot:tig00000826_g4586.t2